MSALFRHQIPTVEPPGYTAPSFPSLYFPFPVGGPQASWLYHPYDVWYFTVAWHLIFFGTVHFLTSGYACMVQYRNWKLIWITPVVYGIVGSIEALIAGSVVGGLLGAIYASGYFRMSTWIPFVWALISSLILILSSFAIQGGL